MLRLNPAQMFRAIASIIGRTAARPTAPEIGFKLPRGEGPQAPRRWRKRAYRANRRKLKGQRNALCHHTRFTVRRGTLRKTHGAGVAETEARREAGERWLAARGLA